VFLFSCSKEDKVKQLVSQYIKESLVNPSDYKAVSFSDPVLVKYELNEDEGYLEIVRSIKKDSFDLSSNDFYIREANREGYSDEYKKQLAELEDGIERSINFKLSRLAMYEDNFKDTLVWLVRHKYKISDKFGTFLETESKLFKLNEELTKVLYAY
jgi:hypothetical protein